MNHPRVASPKPHKLRYPDWKRRKPKVCVVCGITYDNRRTGTKCCSRACGFKLLGKNKTQRELMHCFPPLPSSCRICGVFHGKGKRAFCDKCRMDSDVQRKLSTSKIKPMPCAECGEVFTPIKTKGHFRRTCSIKCAAIMARESRQHHHHIRRARMRIAQRETFRRREIFERDFYFCMLCGKKTDPTKTVPHFNAPTIDHIIPIAKGGWHTRQNCQTAHFICNSLKSDRV